LIQGRQNVALAVFSDKLWRLRGDLLLIPTTIDEMLRFDGPIQYAMGLTSSGAPAHSIRESR
jgi:hypothetical protein